MAEPRLVVTGGGSGLGAATARLAAERGAQVAILDLADRDEVADGEAIRFFRANVTDPTGLGAAFGEACGWLGRLDGVLANAGVNGVQAPLDDLHPEEWRATLAVCLDGTFYTLRAALEHLGSPGAIVVMSSITGTRSFATEGAAAYAAAKAGATALAELAAVELGPRGIRVNVVAPGGVLATRLLSERTTVRHLERLGHERRIDAPLRGEPTSPRDVAEVVLFLLSEAARRISGAVVHVDGAQSLLGGGVLKPSGKQPAVSGLAPEAS